MKVSVEYRHILGGTRKSATGCPISRSLFERTGRTWSIKPPYAFCWPSDGTLYTLPQAATDFINTFDSGDRASPIEFELEEDQ